MATSSDTDAALAPKSDARARRDREDRRLLVRYREHGDLHAREQLAERWMEIGAQLARRYGTRDGAALEEITGVAALGVAKAIDRFDLERTGTFASYALPTVLGEIRRHLRDYSWGMRVPRPVSERAVRIRKTMPKLSQDLGRSPTTREIAEAIGCTMEEALEALDAEHARAATSLQAPTSVDGEGRTVEEVVGKLDDGLRGVEDVATLQRAFEVLEPRDVDILRLRFVEDLTQTEVAERIGISQMHVSRLLRRSISRLRVIFEEQERRTDVALKDASGRARPALH